jgi:hypothetical protein
MYGGGGQYEAGGGQYDGNGAGAANANNLFGGGGFMPSQTTNTPEGSGGVMRVLLFISLPLLIQPNPPLSFAPQI